MNLYMIRNRFCWMVAAVGCCLLPFSCVQEEDGVQVPEHGQGMSLQLKVRAGLIIQVRHRRQRKAISIPFGLCLCEYSE